MRLTRMLRSVGVAAAVFMCLAGTARAQVGTATIKGRITSGASAASAGTSVVAANMATGFTYRTTTQEDGTYAVAGLPPGTYELRITGADGSTVKSEAIVLSVAETAAVDLALGQAAQGEKVEEIVVTGTTRRKDVRSPEVGTVVSRKTIEVLPQASNNFLAAADLAPGVAFVQDQGSGFTRLQSGASNQDSVNVFVDGIGQKNNILRGGMVGQDSSRGNPFPQSAIAGYKVITQNYKAEYDQVSSAAITAVTQSGGNDIHGRVYYDRTGTDLRAKTPSEIDRARAGEKLPSSGKNELGLSVGGPIKEDVLNYFLAYDYKDINDSRQVVGANWDRYDLGVGIMPDLDKKRGSHVDPFKEHLIFGKMNWRASDERKMWASVKVRLEGDTLPEDRNMSSPDNYKDRSNDEVRVDVVHEWSLPNSWLSETKAGYQYFLWNPQSPGNTPEVIYKYSETNLLNQSSEIIRDGSSPDKQKRGQSGVTIAEDLTYTGLRGNVIKTGAKVAAMHYNLTGTSRAVDVVNVLVDTTTGLPYWDGSVCTGDNVINGGLRSDQCSIDRALAPVGVGLNNVQLGLYVQDDWTVTDQLELNLGVRWDYETNMLNNGYETPADRVAAFNAEDVERGGVAPPDGSHQTYGQSLALGGINIDDYIATGDSRKSYPWAIAPRIGFSFDPFKDRSTVIYGGYGRSYDRTMANNALDEKQKNLQPNGELWLMKNEMEMPYSDQVSLGVRQAVSFLNFEAAIGQVHAHNQFFWFSGNRDPNGGWGDFRMPWDPFWGGPSGFGSLILGDTIGETRTKTLTLKAEKPYTRAMPWSATVAYTYSDAETTNVEWNDGVFDWNYGKATRDWHQSKLVEKHRLVALAWTEIPFGFTVVGKYTYGNGTPRRITGCATSGCGFFEGDSPGFHQVDVGLSNTFNVGFGAITLKADVFNAFNKTNWTRRGDAWGGNPVTGGGPTNSVGLSALDADALDYVRGPMRTVKVTAAYSF